MNIPLPLSRGDGCRITQAATGEMGVSQKSLQGTQNTGRGWKPLFRKNIIYPTPAGVAEENRLIFCNPCGVAWYCPSNTGVTLRSPLPIVCKSWRTDETHTVFYIPLPLWWFNMNCHVILLDCLSILTQALTQSNIQEILSTYPRLRRTPTRWAISGGVVVK